MFVSCREFNKNLVKPRTNTEVEAFKRKKKAKKAVAGDDAMGMLLVVRQVVVTVVFPCGLLFACIS